MSADRPVPVRQVVRSVVVVALCLLIGAAGGLIYTKLQHKTYAGTTRIQVAPITLNTTSQVNGRTATTINMDTEAQVVTSAAVLQRAVTAYPTLSKQTFESLISHIAITVPANSVVLDITFTADSPGVAQAGANAIGSAYLDNRAAVATKQLDALRSDTEASQRSRAAQIDKLTQQEANYPSNSPQRRQLQSQITQLASEVKGYGNVLVTLGAMQINPGMTLTAASLPTAPSSPSKVMGLASGLGLGLLLGLLVAWLLNRFRRRVRRPEDIAQVVDLNTIAVLPNLDKGGALSEPYRRVALITTSAVRNADRILFTTPAASPSGSRVAAGVAAALLRGGTPVGLLRINAHALGGPRPRGLDLISVPSTDAITRRHGESLDIALDRVRGRRELLIVDAAGATLSADAQAVAATADAVILVVDARTRSKVLRAAVRALDEVGAPMLGVVLVQSGLRPWRTRSGKDADADYDVLDPPTAWRMPTRQYASAYEVEPAQVPAWPLVLEPPTVDPDPAVVAMLVEEEPPPSRTARPAGTTAASTRERADIVDAEVADDLPAVTEPVEAPVEAPAAQAPTADQPPARPRTRSRGSSGTRADAARDRIARSTSASASTPPTAEPAKKRADKSANGHTKPTGSPRNRQTPSAPSR